MEIRNQKIVTRGVTAGYGYIHENKRGRGWTLSKFWPVRLTSEGTDFEYLKDDRGIPLTCFSREDCLQAIQEEQN